MLHPVIETKLENIKSNLRKGVFTNAIKAGPGCVVLMTNPKIASYEEIYFEAMSREYKAILKDKRVVDIIEGRKIIAIFDDWTGAV